MPFCLERYKYLTSIGLSAFLERNTGGVYTEKPTNLGTQMTIRQLFVQPGQLNRFRETFNRASLPPEIQAFVIYGTVVGSIQKIKPYVKTPVAVTTDAAVPILVQTV